MPQLNIDLWVWDLDDTNPSFETLSRDEIDRAKRFVHAKDLNRFVVARARMREIMSEYLDLAPADVVFDYGLHGKPTLEGCYQFNLSHSENKAALAVVEGAEIGLDIQYFRHVEREVASRFFSDAENNDLAKLSDSEWYSGFFRCWTRKEAVVKAMGQGLSMGLDLFDVSLIPDQPAHLLRFSPAPETVQSWTLHHFELSPELIGAIAVKNNQVPIKLTYR